jgi:hypothetical protein
MDFTSYFHSQMKRVETKQSFDKTYASLFFLLVPREGLTNIFFGSSFRAQKCSANTLSIS